MTKQNKRFESLDVTNELSLDIDRKYNFVSIDIHRDYEDSCVAHLSLREVEALQEALKVAEQHLKGKNI